MSKAIYWPEAYQDALLPSQEGDLQVAWRAGTLYADPPYWVEGEQVDLRLGEQIVAQAVVVADAVCRSAEEWAARGEGHASCLPTGLHTAEAQARYWATLSAEPWAGECLLTCVFYRYLSTPALPFVGNGDIETFFPAPVLA